MQTNNPYEASDSPLANKAANPALLLWSVVVVFGCAVIGGLFGLVTGAALGSFLPGYYRSVFSNGHDPNFDPIAVGMGQGLTQGAIGGVVIGLALVGLYYWYHSRQRDLGH